MHRKRLFKLRRYLDQLNLVHQFPADDSNVVEGTFTILQRIPDGVPIEFETLGLTPGDAYTLWWVISNNPGECSDSGCIVQDLIQVKKGAITRVMAPFLATTRLDRRRDC